MKKWIVNYILSSDNKGIQIISLKAMPEFGETPEFTDSEMEEYIAFLRTRKVPEFKDRLVVAEVDLGLSYKEWDEFVKKNKYDWDNYHR